MVEWKAYPQGEFGDGNAKQGMGPSLLIFVLFMIIE
jgi:hypothetical protein